MASSSVLVGRLFVTTFRVISPSTSVSWTSTPPQTEPISIPDRASTAEFADQIRRGADIENVVKGKFLAVKFFEMFIEIAVECRVLMRIFSITQPHHQWKRK